MGNETSAMDELLNQVEPLIDEDTAGETGETGENNEETTGGAASDVDTGASGNTDLAAGGGDTSDKSAAAEGKNEDAAAVGTETDATVTDDAKDKTGVDPKDQKISALEAEVLSYRQALRSMRRQHLATDSRVSALEKTATSSEEIDPEELAAAKQQQEISQSMRQRELSQYLENMRITDKYGDVDSVVTTRRVDDVLENISATYAKEQGVPFSQALSAVEEHVWTKLQNPYRYLYDLIKKVHPEYASAADKAGTGTDGSGSSSASAGGGQEGQRGVEKQGKTLVNAPTSVQNLGGADAQSTTWTAAKIDALDEEDLGTVPADIYQKWLDRELK